MEQQECEKASALEEYDRQCWEKANASVYLTKAAGEPSLSYDMHGKLYLSESGWLLLKVPNAIVRGIYDALNIPGVELPLRDGRLNAHVTIMDPDDISKIGGPEKITERGHSFPFSLGRIKTVVPTTWDGIGKVWYCQIISPELEALRRSYGLSSRLKDGKHELHLTVAIRRKKVLSNSSVSKVAEQIDPLHSYDQDPDWNEFDRDLIKAATYFPEISVTYTPALVKVALIPEVPQKKKKPFPYLGLAGAGALTGLGAGSYYAGKQLGRLGEVSLPDLHNQLHQMRGGSPNLNWRPWQSNTSPWNYNPQAVKDFEATSHPDAIKVVPQVKLKDYTAPDMSDVNQAVKSTMNSKDLLESQLQYANTGASLLSKPVYGKTTGLDLMAWARHPQNLWWFNRLIPGSRYWGQTWDPKNPTAPPNPNPAPSFENAGANKEHYTEFSKGVGHGYEHMLRETHNQVNQSLDRLADARKQVLQDVVLGRAQAADSPGFQKLVAERMADAYSPHVHPWSGDIQPKPGQEGTPTGILGGMLSGTTRMPLVRNKAINTANELVKHLEGTLAPEHRFSPQMLQTIRGQPAEKIMDQNALVREAFKLKDQTAVTQAMKALSKKQHDLLQKAGPITNAQQSELLYKELSKDPVAHLASTGLPAAGIYSPLAAPFYRTLAAAMQAPGQVAQAASKASPWMRYGGMGAMGAGGAYGLYKLYDYLTSGKKKKTKEAMEKKAIPWGRIGIGLGTAGGLGAAGYGGYQYTTKSVIPEMRTRAQEEILEQAIRATKNFGPPREPSSYSGGTTEEAPDDPRLDPLRDELRSEISKAREYHLGEAQKSVQKRIADVSNDQINQTLLNQVDRSYKNPLAWLGAAGLGATGGAFLGDKKKKVPSAVTGALTGLGLMGGAAAARHFAPNSGVTGALAGAGLGGLAGNLGGSLLGS